MIQRVEGFSTIWCLL